VICARFTARVRREERGAVTAEMAIALPVLVLFLLVITWGIGVVVANIRCVDAARDVARAVARGDSVESAIAIGERTGPPGADVNVARDGSDVVVRVDAAVELDWLLLDALPAVRVSAESRLQVEPTVLDQP